MAIEAKNIIKLAKLIRLTANDETLPEDVKPKTLQDTFESFMKLASVMRFGDEDLTQAQKEITDQEVVDGILGRVLRAIYGSDVDVKAKLKEFGIVTDGRRFVDGFEVYKAMLSLANDFDGIYLQHYGHTSFEHMEPDYQAATILLGALNDLTKAESFRKEVEEFAKTHDSEFYDANKARFEDHDYVLGYLMRKLDSFKQQLPDNSPLKDKLAVLDELEGEILQHMQDIAQLHCAKYASMNEGECPNGEQFASLLEHCDYLLKMRHHQGKTSEEEAMAVLRAASALGLVFAADFTGFPGVTSHTPFQYMGTVTQKTSSISNAALLAIAAKLHLQLGLNTEQLDGILSKVFGEGQKRKMTQTDAASDYQPTSLDGIAQLMGLENFEEFLTANSEKFDSDLGKTTGLLYSYQQALEAGVLPLNKDTKKPLLSFTDFCERDSSVRFRPVGLETEQDHSVAEIIAKTKLHFHIDRAMFQSDKGLRNEIVNKSWQKLVPETQEILSRILGESEFQPSTETSPWVEYSPGMIRGALDHICARHFDPTKQTLEDPDAIHQKFAKVLTLYAELLTFMETQDSKMFPAKKLVDYVVSIAYDDEKMDALIEVISEGKITIEQLEEVLSIRDGMHQNKFTKVEMSDAVDGLIRMYKAENGEVARATIATINKNLAIVNAKDVDISSADYIVAQKELMQLFHRLLPDEAPSTLEVRDQGALPKGLTDPWEVRAFLKDEFEQEAVARYKKATNGVGGSTDNVAAETVADAMATTDAAAVARFAFSHVDSPSDLENMRRTTNAIELSGDKGLVQHDGWYLRKFNGKQKEAEGYLEGTGTHKAQHYSGSDHSFCLFVPRDADTFVGNEAFIEKLADFLEQSGIDEMNFIGFGGDELGVSELEFNAGAINIEGDIKNISLWMRAAKKLESRSGGKKVTLNLDAKAIGIDGQTSSINLRAMAELLGDAKDQGLVGVTSHTVEDFAQLALSLMKTPDNPVNPELGLKVSKFQRKTAVQDAFWGLLFAGIDPSAQEDRVKKVNAIFAERFTQERNEGRGHYNKLVNDLVGEAVEKLPTDQQEQIKSFLKTQFEQKYKEFNDIFRYRSKNPLFPDDHNKPLPQIMKIINGKIVFLSEDRLGEHKLDKGQTLATHTNAQYLPLANILQTHRVQDLGRNRFWEVRMAVQKISYYAEKGFPLDEESKEAVKALLEQEWDVISQHITDEKGKYLADADYIKLQAALETEMHDVVSSVVEEIQSKAEAYKSTALYQLQDKKTVDPHKLYQPFSPLERGAVAASEIMTLDMKPDLLGELLGVKLKAVVSKALAVKEPGLLSPRSAAVSAISFPRRHL